jgi:hypothetical protein
MCTITLAGRAFRNSAFRAEEEGPTFAEEEPRATTIIRQNSRPPRRHPLIALIGRRSPPPTIDPSTRRPSAPPTEGGHHREPSGRIGAESPQTTTERSHAARGVGAPPGTRRELCAMMVGISLAVEWCTSPLII